MQAFQSWLQNFDWLLPLDLLAATALGMVVLGRVTEVRSFWLLRGYLFLVALAWVVQRTASLPLTSKLVDALVMACSLALAVLWQGELRRVMELLGTGRINVLFADRRRDSLASGAVSGVGRSVPALRRLFGFFCLPHLRPTGRGPFPR